MESPTYGVSGDSRSNGLESTDEPEHLLINPLYTIPTTGKNTLSPHATETDASHTYKGIHETKTSERNNNSAEHLLMNPLYTIPTSGKNTLSPYTTEGDVAHTYEGIQETNSPFPYKNNAGPHRPHPSVPSHLELGDPDREREYATLESPGHEYAVLEQPSHAQGQNHKKPQPYELPVTLTLNRDTNKIESVTLNGNHQYAKLEPWRQILNYTPQGHEDIVAMASDGREYAEPDLDKPHTYATLEPPASK